MTAERISHCSKKPSSLPRRRALAVAVTASLALGGFHAREVRADCPAPDVYLATKPGLTTSLAQTLLGPLVSSPNSWVVNSDNWFAFASAATGQPASNIKLSQCAEGNKVAVLTRGGNGNNGVTQYVTYEINGQKEFIGIAAPGDRGVDGGDVLLAVNDPAALSQSSLPGPNPVSDRGYLGTGDIATLNQSIPGQGYGFYVQSIGGKGGDGSSSDGAGADGGVGGNGGTVVMYNAGSIYTTGDRAHAVIGLSEGGEGGEGGFATGWLGTGPGGNGGAGNSGGLVRGFNLGTLSTKGIAADGMYVHSVGGNGANGGVANGAFVAVGGSGGIGGNGNAAEAINFGTIGTLGNLADAMSALSIGGGGGDGGDAHSGGAFLNLAIGGSGGNGGHGGTAKSFNAGGTITTAGRGAVGMRAQSIGGGGGNGGNSVSVAAGFGLAFSLALGGSGGGGGHGNAVWAGHDYYGAGGGNIVTGAGLAQSYTNLANAVANAGNALDVSTFSSSNWFNLDPLVQSGSAGLQGDWAHGILAQSIGGGGGNGGSAFSLSAALGIEGALGINLGLGGTGGTGGNGSEVNVWNDWSDITTYGRNAFAIAAQSIGGGGGNGGNSLVVEASASAGVNGTISVAHGGNGGSGGTGGNVNVNLGRTLNTYGAGSHAVMAQSIGGGGGNGGNVVDVGVVANVGGSFSGALKVDLGGNGGSGNTGGAVNIVGNNAANAASIRTVGDKADGIFAQSVGGGGGNGGNIHSYGFTVQSGASSKSLNANVYIGGYGGSGNAGGTVSLAYNGQLATLGQNATGIKAQSIGGGGGDGGNIFALSVAATLNANVNNDVVDNSSAMAMQVGVNVGGSGGAGSDGGGVVSHLYGNSQIVTHGERSVGLIAQSIGGGGGNGGNVHSFSLATSLPSRDTLLGTAPVTLYNLYKQNPSSRPTQKNLSITADVGGNGGSGGNGGEVDVYLSGSIRTGGGSTSVSNTATLPADGSAPLLELPQFTTSSDQVCARPYSTTSTGNSITFTTCTNHGAQSHGVLAQSIGGGGGTGGSVQADGFTGIGQYTLNIDVGGAGGTGGVGGSVLVGTEDGQPDTVHISTTGDSAFGIIGQSIGGGGGLGGGVATNTYGAIPSYGGTAVGMTSGTALGISVGGNGGSANHAGPVTLYSGAHVTTQGSNAHGMVAQSIGGGGGSASSDGVSATGLLTFDVGGKGGAAGNGSTVWIAGFDITTWGSNANGILAQSIGGGGGDGGFVGDSTGAAQVKIGIALDGGSAGDGAAVNIGCMSGVCTGGNVVTHGNVAHGIWAQSVGGGGGTTHASKLGLPLTKYTGDITLLRSFTGSGGSSGLVTVQDTNSPIHVTTNGHGAMGILAQSLNGGGFSLSLDNARELYTLDNTTGGLGGGDNGGILIDLQGGVTTSGDYAHGIFAQALNSSQTVFDLNGDNASYGWSATNHTGQVHIIPRAGSAIRTSGTGAVGIYTQSNYSGNDWAQWLQMRGSVAVTGSAAWAVHTLNGHIDRDVDRTSINTDSHVSIDLYDNASVTAAAQSAGAIWMENYQGANKLQVLQNSTVQMLNRATIADCPQNNCVVATLRSATRNDMVVDPGASILGGTLVLEAPVNSLNINGTLQSPLGASAIAQFESWVRGSASIVVGSTGKVTGGISSSNGSVANQGTITLRVGTQGWKTDAINVTNYTGNAPRVMLAELLQGTFQSVDLMNVSGGGLTPSQIPAPLGLATQLTLDSTASRVSLSDVVVDYNVAGLDAGLVTAAKLASDQVYALRTGDATFEPTSGAVTPQSPLYDTLLDMANASNLPDLANSLQHFAADAHYGDAQSSQLAAYYSLIHMHSCGGIESASVNPVEQGECNWGKLSFEESERRSGAFRDTVWSLNGGQQREFNERWHLGWSFGYSDTRFEGRFAGSEGQFVSLGAIAKYVHGNAFAAASVVAGYSWADGERRTWLPGASAAVTAESRHRTQTLAASLRSGYQFALSPEFSVIPMLDVNVPVVHDRGYVESGAGAFNIEVLSSTNVVPDLHPKLQLSQHFTTGEASVRGWLEVGTRLRDEDYENTVRLPNGFAGDDTSTIVQVTDKHTTTWAAGMVVDWTDRLESRLVYEGEDGDTTETRRASFKFAWKF